MRVLFVWLHVVAAAVWLGSMVFLALGVLPVLRRPEYRTVYGPILHAVGLRIRWIGWAALAVLVLTGLHNLAALGFGWSHVVSGQIWAGPFGRALAWKLGLIGGIVGLNLLHDLWFGPRVTRGWQTDPSDPSLRWVRPAAAWVGRLVVLLTLAVFYLGVTLTRGGLP
jgi:putative copper export protein